MSISNRASYVIFETGFCSTGMGPKSVPFYFLTYSKFRENNIMIIKKIYLEFLAKLSVLGYSWKWFLEKVWMDVYMSVASLNIWTTEPGFPKLTPNMYFRATYRWEKLFRKVCKSTLILVKHSQSIFQF